MKSTDNEVFELLAMAEQTKARSNHGAMIGVSCGFLSVALREILAARRVVEAARKSHDLREAAYDSNEDTQNDSAGDIACAAASARADEIEGRIADALAAYDEATR